MRNATCVETQTSDSSRPAAYSLYCGLVYTARVGEFNEREKERERERVRMFATLTLTGCFKINPLFSNMRTKRSTRPLVGTFSNVATAAVSTMKFMMLYKIIRHFLKSGWLRGVRFVPKSHHFGALIAPLLCQSYSSAQLSQPITFRNKIQLANQLKKFCQQMAKFYFS